MDKIDKQTLESIDIHALPDVMSIALWVIEYTSNDESKYFGASEIAQYMIERLGISTSRQAVHSALTKAVSKKFCHKNKVGFGLMKLGRDELLKQINRETVVFLEPGKPFTAGMKVESIFKKMKGTIKISDPYVDIKTLDLIHRSMDANIPIRLLTVQVKDEAMVKREVQKLQIEGFNFEIRKVSSGVLHDRYLIDNNNFWLSGNSLNNIGKKESFIIMLGGDMRNILNQTFDSRWSSAVSV